MKHELQPIETALSPHTSNDYTYLYRQVCSCGWHTKWYVQRGNAAQRAKLHLAFGADYDERTSAGVHSAEW